MKDEIRVGEYVRINNDFRLIALGIGKVIKINRDTIYTKMNFEMPFSFKIENIAKHSFNLIDLIENKDVLKVRIDKEIMLFGMDEDTLDIKYKELIEDIENGEYELLEILTHEQFEQNSYKVGGKDE